MTTLKLHFSGHIKKSTTRQAGTKTVTELQLCKKLPGKDGQPDSFTWIKVTIWSPQDWQSPRLVAGGYISGYGDFVMRSYVKTDQTKGVSGEVRCSSFDIDMPDDRISSVPADSSPVLAVPEVSSVSSKMDVLSKDEPPF